MTTTTAMAMAMTYRRDDDRADAGALRDESVDCTAGPVLFYHTVHNTMVVVRGSGPRRSKTREKHFHQCCFFVVVVYIIIVIRWCSRRGRRHTREIAASTVRGPTMSRNNDRNTSATVFFQFGAHEKRERRRR